MVLGCHNLWLHHNKLAIITHLVSSLHRSSRPILLIQLVGVENSITISMFILLFLAAPAVFGCFSAYDLSATVDIAHLCTATEDNDQDGNEDYHYDWDTYCKG